MTALDDVIAECVIQAFELLPQKAKPRQYANGKREWVPLSGIVLSKDGTKTYICVSLGTGMRCLPASKVALAKGRCLHDWHAEIVSLRAFNRFLIDECALLASNPAKSSLWIRRRTTSEIIDDSAQPFAIKDDVHIDMYCSEAPCGDASMELVMGSQADATPWPLPSRPDLVSTMLDGRGHFSELGVVRRKPARGDAPATMSKSCSDKLALKQCTSLLSSISSLLLHPSSAYLRYLVLPSSRYCATSIERSFSAHGRMSCLALPDGSSREWGGGYRFRPFQIRQTTQEFNFSRTKTNQQVIPSGSNVTAVWTPNNNEVLIGGTIQGHKQFSARGGSALCKLHMWRAALGVAQRLANHELIQILGQRLYSSVKQCARLSQRRQVKADATTRALRGWMANDAGDDFALLDDE